MARSAGISPWVRSWRQHQGAGQPCDLRAAFSMAPLAGGSYAGGDSRTVCAPDRAATARRKSTSAGSLPVLSRARW
eukprot:6507628-Alexandrium_andersonii.AAC.1